MTKEFLSVIEKNNDIGFIGYAKQDGGHWARQSWPAGQVVYYVPPSAYRAQTGAAKALYGEGALIPYDGYMAVRKATGIVAVWVPSMEDLLADDYFQVS